MNEPGPISDSCTINDLSPNSKSTTKNESPCTTNSCGNNNHGNGCSSISNNNTDYNNKDTTTNNTNKFYPHCHNFDHLPCNKPQIRCHFDHIQYNKPQIQIIGIIIDKHNNKSDITTIRPSKKGERIIDQNDNGDDEDDDHTQCIYYEECECNNKID